MNEDLAVIRVEDEKLVARNLKFLSRSCRRKRRVESFRAWPYKLELIDELPDETVSIYRRGEFVDLCRASRGLYLRRSLTNSRWY